MNPPSDRVAGRSARAIPVILGLSAAAIGMWFMAGWATGADGVLLDHHGYGQMQFNTALCFTLMGLSLAFMHRRRTWLSGGLASVVLVFAGLPLIEYATGTGSGIHQLLVDHTSGPANPYPGRMGFGTALAFTLAGSTVLIATHVRSIAPWPNLLGLIVVALGLISAIGHLMLHDLVTGWEHLTKMSLQSAAGFILIGAGLYAAAWRAPAWRWRFAFGPMSVNLAVVTLFAAGWSTIKAQESARRETVRRWIMAQAAERTNETIRLKLGALDRLAARWPAGAEAPTERWRADATRYLADMPELTRIALIDASGATLIDVPRLPDSADSLPVKVIDAVRALSQETDSAAAFCGEPDDARVVIRYPIDRGSRGAGSLIFVLDENGLLERSLEPNSYEGTFTVSREPVGTSSTAPIRLLGVEWHLSAELTPAYVGMLGSGWVYAIPEIGIIVWVLVTGGMLWLQRIDRDRGRLRHLLVELDSYKGALDQSAIVAITDPAGVITHVNDMFCQISGYSREELLGQTHRIINSGHHDKAFFCELWRTIAAGKVWHGEICNRAKDGSQYWVDTTIVPFKDKAGKIIKHVAIRFDITDRKQSERELEQKNEELGRFVYTASHDLKSPIVTICGYLEYLKEDLAKGRHDELDEYAERIGNAALRLQANVRDLLELSRVTTAPLAIGTPRISDAVREALLMHEPEVDERGVTIVLDIRHDTLRCDPRHLDQVVSNLISNALRYGCDVPDPGITIRSEMCEPGVVTLTIEDRGPGVPQQHTDKIFGVFEQLSRRKDSTGIGLAVVRRVAEVYGGTAWYETAPGGGASFRVQLPGFGVEQECASDDQRQHAAPSDPVPAR